MKRFLSAVFLGAAAMAFGGDLGELLEDPAALWEMSPDAVMEKYPKKLVRRGNLVQADLKSLKEFTLEDKPVGDLTFMFRDDKLAAVRVAVFSRSDSGKPMPARDGEDRMEALEKRITSFYLPGSHGRKRNPVRLHNIKIRSTLFAGEKFSIDLASGTGENGVYEFIALEFLRPGENPDALRRAMRARVTPAELLERRRPEEGGYSLELPAMSSGPKGYCIPAAVARILRYYGGEADLRALAGMLEADAQRGVDLDTAVRLLKKYDTKLGVRVNELYRFPEFDPRRVRVFLKRYNNLARKLDRPRLDLTKKLGGMMFDETVMTELRKDPARCDVFFRQVRAGIDRGVPLCWGAMTFPKKEGGKCEITLLLITGYQDSPRQIICSNGSADGEKTVIPVETAWTMTLRLFTLNLRI